MKVIGKNKDIYDFAGYWQSDIIYRRKLEKIRLNIDRNLFQSIRAFDDKIADKIATVYHPLQKFSLLVCGDIYTTYFDSSKKIFVNAEDLKNYKFTSYWSKPSAPNKKALIELHKQLKTPIIGFGRCNFETIYSKNNYNALSIVVEKDANLVQYGVTHLNPEILHREIEFFISNELREEMPMPEFSDKEKLEQHGFDKKISFRKVK